MADTNRLQQIYNQDRTLALTEQRALNSELNAESKLSGNNNGNQKILSNNTESKSDADVLTRVGNTAADVIGNVIVGASKGVEGIVDFAANITGLFGDDSYKEKIKNFVKNNWTEETIQNSSLFQSLTDDSYIKDASQTVQNIAYGVTQGVGQMLPSIALAAATGGLGASAAVSEAVSLATMGLGAAGSATESAYNENADYGEATLFGVLDGALEIATEKMFGGVKATGVTGWLDKSVDGVVDKFATTVGKRQFVNFLADIGEEGIEEMVSEVVEPYIKRATYDKDAENATFGEVIEAGVIGGLTAAVMNGSSSMISKHNLVTPNSSAHNRAMANIEKAEIAQKNYEIAAKKGDSALMESSQREKQMYLEKAQSELNSLSDKYKQKYLKEDRISKNIQRQARANAIDTYFDDKIQIRNGSYLTTEQVSEKATNIKTNMELKGKVSLSNYDRNIQSVLDDFNEANKTAGIHITIDNIKNAETSKNNQRLLKEISETPELQGVNVIFVEKGTLPNGVPATTSRSSDTIFIDASVDNFTKLDEYTSHEIVAHYLVNKNGTFGNAIGKRIQKQVQNLIAKDESMNKTISSILAKRQSEYGEKLINEKTGELTDLGKEEMVGEFIQQVYSHDGITLLHKLANKNQTLLKKLVNFFKDSVNGISHKDSDFYKMFKRDMQQFEGLVSIALKNRDASVNDIENIFLQGQWLTEEEMEERVDMRNSYATWNSKGRALLKRTCEILGVDPQPIINQMEHMYKVLKQAAEEFTLGTLDKNLNATVQYGIVKDAQGNFKPVASVLVKNGDYVINFDLSTKCKKKYYFQKVIERLASQGFFDKNSYTPEDIQSIRTIMQAEGYEIPCAMCFVENRRIYQGDWAKALTNMIANAIGQVYGADYLDKEENFANFGHKSGDAEKDFWEWQGQYNKQLSKDRERNEKNLLKLKGKNNQQKILDYVKWCKEQGHDMKVLKLDDFLTAMGMAQIRKYYPEIAAISLSSYGAGTPKITLDYTPYNSEFAALSNNLVKDTFGSGISGFGAYYKKYETEWYNEHPKQKKTDEAEILITNKAMKDFLLDIGGARFQSFSDAQIEEVFDILQLLADGAACGYSMELYSKEWWEHRTLGKSGIKQNMSLISLVFDKQEGFTDNECKLLGGLKEISSPSESSTKITIALAKDTNGKLLTKTKEVNGVKFKYPIAVTKENAHLYPNVAYFETIFADYETNKKYKEATHPCYADEVVDKDGNVLKAGTPIQSIGYKDSIALMLLDGYSSNVGNIAIGFSYAHIVAMLDNPLIRMVIPFHKSGLNKVYAAVLKCETATDFTDFQSTKLNEIENLVIKDENGNIVEVNSTLLNKVKKAFNSNQFVWNHELQEFQKRGLGARECASAYIEWCRQKHQINEQEIKIGKDDAQEIYYISCTASFIPKFDMLTWHPNYYKLLEDFNCYDCITEQPAPQGEMKFILPDGNYTQEQLDAYANRLRETGIFSEKEIQKYVQKAQMTVSEIIEAEVKNRADYIHEHDAMFEDTYKEIEDALSTHKNAAIKFNAREGKWKTYPTKLTRERESIAYEAGFNIDEMTNTFALDSSPIKIPDTRNAINFDSDGVKLSNEQVEFFKDSKMRDNDGKLIPMYHGTDKGGFTIFDSSKSDDNRSFFFASDMRVAESYINNESAYRNQNGKSLVYKTYLNLKDPLIIDAHQSNYNRVPIREYIINKKTLKYPFKDGDVSLTFLNQQDYDAFEKDFGMDSLKKKYSDNDDVLYEQEKAVNQYLKYFHKNANKWISFQDFFDNYKEYTWLEAYAVFEEYEDNIEPLGDLFDWNNGNYDAFIEQMKTDLFGDLIEEDSNYLNDTFTLVFGDNGDIGFERKNTRQVSSYAQANGYDGVIFKNIMDIGGGIQPNINENHYSTIAIAFNPSDIKLVTNSHPTENVDIRFAREESNNSTPSKKPIVTLFDSNNAPIEYESKFKAVSEIISKKYGNDSLLNFKNHQELKRKVTAMSAEYTKHIGDNAWMNEYNQLVDAFLKSQVVERVLNSAIALTGQDNEGYRKTIEELKKQGYDVEDRVVNMDDIVATTQEILIKTGYYHVDKKGNYVPNKAFMKQFIEELKAVSSIAQADIDNMTTTTNKIRALFQEQKQIWQKKLSVFSKLRTLRDILFQRNNAKALNIKLKENKQFSKALKQFSNSSLWKNISKLKFKDFVDFMVGNTNGKVGWFTKENELLRGVVWNEDGTEVVGYEELVDALQRMVNYYSTSANKKLDTLEFYQDMETILIQSRKLLVSFDQRFFGEKKIAIAEQSQKLIDNAKENFRIRPKGVSKIGQIITKITDPRTMFLELCGYDEDAPLMQMFDQIQKDEVDAINTFHDLTEEISKMVSSKKYSKHLTKEYMEIKAVVNGEETTIKISYDQAINLYLQATQPSTHKGFREHGFSFKNEKGKDVHVDSYNPYNIIGGTEYDEKTKKMVEHKGWQFSDEDKRYMALLVGEETSELDDYGLPKRKGGMFGKLTELKREADIKINGTTNVVDDHFYYPIARIQSEFSKNLANINASNFAQTLYNITANKDRNMNATAGIQASSSFEGAIQQANLMSKYVRMGLDFDTIGRALGLSQNQAVGGKTSAWFELNKIHPDAKNYIVKLLSDMIGNSGSQNRVIARIRQAWTTAQLGFSPKIVVSQLASIPTLITYYDVDLIGRGIARSIGNRKQALAEMNEHSAYGKSRYRDNPIFRAESVTDPSARLNRFASVFTAPSNWTDLQAFLAAWETAKLQVQRYNSTLKVGSEEYWNKVDEVFTSTTRRTQPQFNQSERSAMMRSNNEIVKSLTMFSSDPVKQLSICVQAVGGKLFRKRAMKYYEQLIASENTTEEAKKEYKKQLKKLEDADAKAPFKRSLISVLTADVVFVLIKRLFDLLYNRDDEDKDGNEISWWEQTFIDLGSSIVGMFPIIKDIYAYFVQGYDVENYTYSMVNDVLSSTEKVVDVISAYASGEDVSDAKLLNTGRSLTYSISAMLGLPTRNAQNFITGIISRFSEEFKYDYKNAFSSSHTYASDIAKANEKGDTELAEHIFDLYVSSKGVEASSGTKSILADLYSKGYSNVLPKAVGDTITYNSEEYALSKKEKERFKQVYNQAESNIQNLTRYDLFQKASDETKSKAIKMIYDYYYTMAIHDYIGDGTMSKTELFAEIIPIEKLAIIVQECKAVESDGTANNRKIQIMKIINKQRLTNAQKYMILGYLGYTNDVGRSQVSAVIKKSISKEYQKTMLEYCGYTTE